jgi:pimeloyl-ACP methyl ester carboxylesterase
VATGANRRGPASRRGRLRRWIVRGLLALVGLVVVVVLVGLVYQFVATRLAYRKYPAPGQMVAVSGHGMHLYCTGEGREGPTVVMDSGLGGGVLDWQTVQPDVAKFARVCSYDRSGIGWSESGPKPRTSPRIVEELHALLKNAGVGGPYVLVGHSFGGANAQLYAAEYPEEVAGMVLVDSALDIRVLDKDLRNDVAGAGPSPLTIKVVAPLGIARLFAGGNGSGEGGPPKGLEMKGTRYTTAPATSTRSPTRAPMCRRASPRRPTPPPRWGTSRL